MERWNVGKLDQMDRDELERERRETEKRLKEIEKAQTEYQGRRIKELRAEIDTMLDREGFTIEDIYGGRSGKRASSTRSKGPAKCRDPENPSKTWSGRGRQPVWYKEAIANGASPDDLKV